MPRKGRPWTQHEIAMLRRAAAANRAMSLAHGAGRLRLLAAEIGRTPKAVYVKATKMGIGSRPRECPIWQERNPDAHRTIARDWYRRAAARRESAS